VVVRCVWTQFPASQPAFVQALLSESVHGVESCFGGCGHVPVAVSQPGFVRHSFGESGHVVVRCPWTHCPASQPALVQALPSLSVQGVESGTFWRLQAPVAGSQASAV
jgi:hypothetical protein